MQNRDVEILKLLIVTDATLIIAAAMLENVGLAGHSAPETKHDGLRDRACPIVDGIQNQVALTSYLVRVRSIAKSQGQARTQDLRGACRLERRSHGSGSLSRCQVAVAL